ncbi:MAG: 2OG-Fe(II) oxygenase [Alphaproteobacteria bacterium]
MDSKDKIITVLLYLNAAWGTEAGRLRLLRNNRDLEDYAAEVPPDAGTLLIFQCTPQAWHGHKPFEGERRVIQLNWVASSYYVWREQFRHRLLGLVETPSSAA